MSDEATWWRCTYKQPMNLRTDRVWACQLDAGHTGMHVLKTEEVPHDAHV